jgi:hypothetical protein
MAQRAYFRDILCAQMGMLSKLPDQDLMDLRQEQLLTFGVVSNDIARAIECGKRRDDVAILRRSIQETNLLAR